MPVDKLWKSFVHLRPAEPETFKGRHTYICKKNISFRKQLVHCLDAALRFEVDGHEPLAAVLNSEERVFIILAHDHLEFTAAAVIVSCESLYLYDIRAVGTEHSAGSGCRDDRRKLDDLQPFKG